MVDRYALTDLRQLQSVDVKGMRPDNTGDYVKYEDHETMEINRDYWKGEFNLKCVEVSDLRDELTCAAEDYALLKADCDRLANLPCNNKLEDKLSLANDAVAYWMSQNNDNIQRLKFKSDELEEARKSFKIANASADATKPLKEDQEKWTVHWCKKSVAWKSKCIKAQEDCSIACDSVKYWKHESSTHKIRSEERLRRLNESKLRVQTLMDVIKSLKEAT